MHLHMPPFDNQNTALFDVNNDTVPLTYFNIVKLSHGDTFDSEVPGYETCIVPATGTITVRIGSEVFEDIGQRTAHVWDGDPEGVYVPTGQTAHLVCMSETAEVFIAGAVWSKPFAPFAVRAAEIDTVQYGSDDTKTHRKIKHILGNQYHDRVGRLLVSELYTVGAGGWSGFPPHTHQEDRGSAETCHHEIYNFRFNPDHGFGMQLMQNKDQSVGEAFHLVDGSTFAFNSGYHPCVAAPGYEMYYFTILGGQHQRSLVQSFQPEHAYQLETIPGMKDMIAKFK